MTAERVQAIRNRLQAELTPEFLEVEDESHLHIGHAGARDGRGHFKVTVISPAFTGLPRLARHRLIYAAMGSLMETDVHALTIQSLAPEEI